MHPQRLSRITNLEKRNYLLMVPKMKKDCLETLEAVSDKVEKQITGLPLGSKIDVLPGTNIHLYMRNFGNRVS